jgi:putative membrane protein
MPPHAPGADFADQHAHWAAHGPSLFPFFGGLMFLLFVILVIATIAFVRRGGQLGAPPWARRVQSPEFEARNILATRFATGDISSDEFLERASVLNWTPGVEPLPVPRKRRR